MSGYLDTRDLEKELTELEERDAACDECNGTGIGSGTRTEMRCDFCNGTGKEGGDPLESDERERMEALDSLRDEISEWHSGETLIPEDEWEEYARETAYDIGAIDRDAAWPANRIDWARAADDLRQDYSECELDGVTYLYRAS